MEGLLQYLYINKIELEVLHLSAYITTTTQFPHLLCLQSYVGVWIFVSKILRLNIQKDNFCSRCMFLQISLAITVKLLLDQLPTFHIYFAFLRFSCESSLVKSLRPLTNGQLLLSPCIFIHWAWECCHLSAYSTTKCYLCLSMHIMTFSKCK